MSGMRTVEQELGSCVLYLPLTRAQARAVVKVLRGEKPNAADTRKIFAALTLIDDAMDDQARSHALLSQEAK